MKTVVVGASSGLGRSIAIALGQSGASVALLARRHDRLVDAAKEAGPGSLAIECDVTDASSCRSAIEEAAAGLGGIDALVYSTGVGHLGRLVDADVEAWQRSFSTNVIGAALVTAAAIPYLTASAGVAVYLSSVSASLTPPWPGLGVYITSKAALVKLVDAFRAEHPSVGFTNVIVGDCAGGEGPSMTEFVNNWSPELMGELFPLWEARSLLAGSLVEVDELIRVVDTVLRCGATRQHPLGGGDPQKRAGRQRTAGLSGRPTADAGAGTLRGPIRSAAEQHAGDGGGRREGAGNARAHVAAVGDQDGAADGGRGVATEEDQRVGLLERRGRLRSQLAAVVGSEAQPRLRVGLGQGCRASAPGRWH